MNKISEAVENVNMSEWIANLCGCERYFLRYFLEYCSDEVIFALHMTIYEATPHSQFDYLLTRNFMTGTGLKISCATSLFASCLFEDEVGATF